jgi:hypothetical protein
MEVVMPQGVGFELEIRGRPSGPIIEFQNITNPAAALRHTRYLHSNGYSVRTYRVDADGNRLGYPLASNVARWSL